MRHDVFNYALGRLSLVSREALRRTCVIHNTAPDSIPVARGYLHPAFEVVFTTVDRVRDSAEFEEHSPCFVYLVKLVASVTVSEFVRGRSTTDGTEKPTGRYSGIYRGRSSEFDGEREREREKGRDENKREESAKAP